MAAAMLPMISRSHPSAITTAARSSRIKPASFCRAKTWPTAMDYTTWPATSTNGVGIGRMLFGTGNLVPPIAIQPGRPLAQQTTLAT